MPTLNIPATLEQLAVVRNMIEQNIKPEYAPILLKIELAVEELLTNVCNYAYNGKLGKASVSCNEADLDNQNYFSITIIDYGAPYDPFSMANEPDLESDIDKRPIGGVGIYLIKQVTSHYIYTRIDDKNVIQLFFAPVTQLQL